MKKNINIMIMGPQGSGKGTQARLLAKKYDLQMFETGSVLREIASQDTEIGRKINEIMHVKGNIIPWDIMKEKILGQKLDGLDENKGIIFDGTPRIIEEAEFWEKKLKEVGRKVDYIFYVDVPKEESIKRLSVRKLCRENGHPLIVGKNLKEEDTKCPICGSEVYRREDDTPEKILKRLEWSGKLISPVLEYYKNKGMLIKVNGVNSVEEVFKEILEKIEQT
ncbi:MAG: nucleoside monophosphate kinase [Candidatus Pacebacteria bacterium]|nr:nucleoside monophosphate kinase [Candidatus Paceibacterota bacterium]